ncbi:hypothetical protein BB560_003068 [Smittium megazygosporum]|uniref:EamA domain-containing protein n=1 Tax=Smittium megazygosporum TaxID=133381 RepID=A0A2T9ZD59_9FUNG|nr:hypothetical protein BB560_003068 [Smittium megazygosporum]
MNTQNPDQIRPVSGTPEDPAIDSSFITGKELEAHQLDEAHSSHNLRFLENESKIKSSRASRLIYLGKVILLGQVLSLCISGSSSLVTALTNRKGVDIPITTTFFLYVMLMLVYFTYSMVKHRKRSISNFKSIWYWYLLLAIVDVEGNYFVVKAYSYTSLLHASLLDEWTLPCVVILSVLIMKVRYKLIHYISILICISGIAILIFLDNKSSSSEFKPPNIVLGDIFMIIGATCYAFSNILLEYISRQRPIFETLGFLGLFGTLVNGIQLAILARSELKGIHWDGEIVGYIIGFVSCLFLMYSLTPILFRMSSATFLNLSLITSDVYILLIGIYAFGYSVSRLYALAFVLVILGLVMFNISPKLANKNLNYPKQTEPALYLASQLFNRTNLLQNLTSRTQNIKGKSTKKSNYLN